MAQLSTAMSHDQNATAVHFLISNLFFFCCSCSCGADSDVCDGVSSKVGCTCTGVSQESVTEPQPQVDPLEAVDRYRYPCGQCHSFLVLFVPLSMSLLLEFNVILTSY